MADILLEIEGAGAVAATEELLQIEGLAGNWEPASTEVQREGVLTTIATIVGIVGGTIAIAEKIHQWYQKHRQKPGSSTIDKAILIGRNGDRILLKDASIEQIRRL